MTVRRLILTLVVLVAVAGAVFWFAHHRRWVDLVEDAALPAPPAPKQP